MYNYWTNIDEVVSNHEERQYDCSLATFTRNCDPLISSRSHAAYIDLWKPCNLINIVLA